MASGWLNSAQFAVRIQKIPSTLGSYRLSSPLAQPAIQCLPEKQPEAKILLPPTRTYGNTLKMEAESSNEASVTAYQSTWRHTREYGNLYSVLYLKWKAFLISHIK
jgi:hypothetical protein